MKTQIPNSKIDRIALLLQQHQQEVAQLLKKQRREMLEEIIKLDASQGK